MRITLQELNMTCPNGKEALQGVNASLDSPSLIDLLGPSGAGKSTLMKLLVADLLPTGDAIRTDGKPLTKCERAYKVCLGYLLQDLSLFDELAVEQFLDYTGALEGLRNGRESIRAVIKVVHLGERRRTGIRILSDGQRRRVDTAQALLGDPAFSIFDGPTVGLDPEEHVHFRNLFSRLAQNRLVLPSAHIIEDVQSVCSCLLVLHQEWLYFDGIPEEFTRATEDHMGTFETRTGGREDGLHIITRVNTARDVACRVMVETLPPHIRPAGSTPGDAHFYLTPGEGEA